VAAGRARLPAAAAVAVLPFVAGLTLIWPYPVERLHPVDQILAVELVGVCVDREDLRAELPYTNAHLIEDRFREKHVPGFVNTMFLFSPAEHRPTDVNYVGEVVNGEQKLGSRHAELVADYRRALRVAPGAVAAVKWRTFWGHLTMDHRGEYWHPTGIVPNTLGLVPNRGFAGVRDRLADVDRAADESAVARLVVMNHLPWAGLNLLTTAAAAAREPAGAGRATGAARPARVRRVVRAGHGRAAVPVHVPGHPPGADGGAGRGRRPGRPAVLRARVTPLSS
jgi:hypothetical protein